MEHARNTEVSITWPPHLVQPRGWRMSRLQSRSRTSHPPNHFVGRSMLPWPCPATMDCRFASERSRCLNRVYLRHSLYVSIARLPPTYQRTPVTLPCLIRDSKQRERHATTVSSGNSLDHGHSASIRSGYLGLLLLPRSPGGIGYYLRLPCSLVDSSLQDPDRMRQDPSCMSNLGCHGRLQYALWNVVPKT